MTATHATEPTELAERHANNLELFLDLVFVFAVTQVASFISHDPSGTGVAKGALLAFLVWWQWSQFTWAGAATDLQNHAGARSIVLILVPLTLMTAVGIPDVYGKFAPWFAWFYLGVQFAVLTLQGSFTRSRAEFWRSFVRYAAVGCLSPTLVVIGSYAGKNQVWWWAAAAAFLVVAAFRGAGGSWAINPTHFAERHALFTIVALGEVVVAVGPRPTQSPRSTA